MMLILIKDRDILELKRNLERRIKLFEKLTTFY